MVTTPIALRSWLLATGAFLLWMTPVSMASDIVGKVVNRSRNRASAGDQVVLYRVGPTMQELARTKSMEDGSFRFENQSEAHYLVAAVHQKISYHTRTLTGSAPFEIFVYDAAQTPNGVLEQSNTLFLQADNGQLRVTEFFVVENRSNPPRTWAGNQTFTFRLPPGAVLDSTAIQPPETLPLLAEPSSCGAPGQYCIAYPIHPGITKVRAVYHLRYSGSATIAPTLLRPVHEMAVMVPDSIHFEARTAGVFQNRGAHNGLTMYLATRVRPGQSLEFRLSAGNRAGTKSTDTATGNWKSFSAAGVSSVSFSPTVGAALPVPASVHWSQERWLASSALLVTVLASAGWMGTIAFKKPEA